MDTSSTFRMAFFILLGGMLVVRIYFNLRLKRAGERFMPDQQAIRHEGVGLFASRAILFFVLIAILVLYAIHHPWMQSLDFYLPPWLRWLGFVIGLLSIALMVWVELELGRQFSPQLQLRQEHQLITSGPYSRVRHPLYTALDAYGLSLALVSANWFFVAFFILSLIGLHLRVPKEERMLLGQFGDQYRAYMQRTGRYFPKM
jgi:protein-S-isoprenylcysteine O-methyltransferase Ste14